MCIPLHHSQNGCSDSGNTEIDACAFTPSSTPITVIFGNEQDLHYTFSPSPPFPLAATFPSINKPASHQQCMRFNPQKAIQRTVSCNVHALVHLLSRASVFIKVSKLTSIFLVCRLFLPQRDPKC
jgi:hypothetical protein